MIRISSTMKKSVKTSEKYLIQQQQRVVDTWEGKLRATRGALRDEKSNWYMIDYKYKRNL